MNDEWWIALVMLFAGIGVSFYNDHHWYSYLAWTVFVELGILGHYLGWDR